MNSNFWTVRGYELKGYNKTNLTPALEDYLEMIYRNTLVESYIRINTLAKLLNVRDSSASKMVKKLGELGLVNYEKYGIITLTEAGKNEGEFLLNRHNIIEQFLYFIGCEDNTLLQTEMIEHYISTSTIENIEILYNFFYDNRDILERYINYREVNLEK
ncbi:iron dependent repressor, metal binding and dimerization domain protein [Tissierella sp. MB52-C2]|uniref:metal-dependent transcriptional regulator n=1 Tax=Tissierella sp. MB52-C2 TaxID=3070999 RepID=UPI00280C27BC|nr:iron dependent repressor, metal binding and dimerization domain protein [Tissierella sp. MB52-C2]WMM26405.1 iron dependent repressor, metal binding and dimerization domain protein [Tissierella sp. MB52-C2]